MAKNSFAFIIYPSNIDSFLEFFDWIPVLHRVPRYYLKSLIKYCPPLRIISVKNIKSKNGQEVDGEIILCPFLPEQFATLDPLFVLKRLCLAVRLAKWFQVRIVGLAGFTSIFSNQGQDIVSSEKDVAITTGNSFTAAMAIKGVVKSAEILNKDTRNATLVVIGATGDIGAICTKMLGKLFKKVIIVARNSDKLLQLQSELQSEGILTVEINDDINDATKLADFILCTTNAITTVISEECIRPGAVVCDVSVPANVARNLVEKRNDVLIFEGGYAAMPNFNELPVSFRRHFRFGSIFGCLAETIILALEGRFENFSIGRGNITSEKVEEISRLGSKHGFALAPYFCGNKIFVEEDFCRIRSIVNRTVVAHKI